MLFLCVPYPFSLCPPTMVPASGSAQHHCHPPPTSIHRHRCPPRNHQHHRTSYPIPSLINNSHPLPLSSIYSHLPTSSSSIITNVNKYVNANFLRKAIAHLRSRRFIEIYIHSECASEKGEAGATEMATQNNTTRLVYIRQRNQPKTKRNAFESRENMFLF